MKTSHLLLPIMAVILLLGSCASFEFNEGQKTTQLHQGMSYAEVVELLGEPKSSQLEHGKLMVRWSLHVIYKGFVPYDMAFNAKTRKLVSWRANEEEYQKSQLQMQPVVDAIQSANKTNSNSGSGGSISNTANGTAGSGRDAEGRNCTFVSIPNGDGIMSCN